jgi:4a-hydroxytetrahydrobiopterin dehydratase
MHALQGRHPATDAGRGRALAQTGQWEVRDEARQIEHTFRFKNFGGALSFVQKVGGLAEAEGHHPDICFGWGYAKVALQTKKIKRSARE